MLDFEFTDEQKRIQGSVGKFCQQHVVPEIRRIEDEGKIPDDIIRSLADQGLFGMPVSRNYGGMEADPITVGIVAEQIARADISCAIPTFFLVQAAWGYIFDKYGTEKAKKDILPPVTGGQAFLGIAISEPHAGSDIANIKTSAERSGDHYVIHGEKKYISGVREVMTQLQQGGGHLTIAKTDPGKGTRGMSLFYIPLKNRKGIRPTYIEEWGRRGISTGGFILENVDVPKEYLLGEENKGFYILMEGFDFARAIISVICCGAAMSSLEQAMERLKSRKAFGQPLGRFQSIQFKIAEHWAKLEALRLAGYRALWMYGKEQQDQSYNRFQVTKACAEAKMLAPIIAFEAINDAIQWFGAFGYTIDCPLDLALKGVRSYYWAEGTLEVMRTIVSRELLGKE
jgi:acyl-CoA dehydrogenase